MALTGSECTPAGFGAQPSLPVPAMSGPMRLRVQKLGFGQKGELAH